MFPKINQMSQYRRMTADPAELNLLAQAAVEFDPHGYNEIIEGLDDQGARLLMLPDGPAEFGDWVRRQISIFEGDDHWLCR